MNTELSSHPIRLTVPALMFVAFAGSHYLATSSSDLPIRVVRARSDISEGHNITLDDLGYAEIVGSSDLLQTFVHYSDRAQYAGLPVSRNVVAGELLCLKDLQQPTIKQMELEPGEDGLPISLSRVDYSEKELVVGMNLSFAVAGPTADIEVIGPFRVVAIGGTAHRNATSESPGADQDGKQITIASKTVDGRFDLMTTRLLKAQNNLDDNGEKIIGIVYPGRRPDADRASRQPVADH